MDQALAKRADLLDPRLAGRTEYLAQAASELPKEMTVSDAKTTVSTANSAAFSMISRFVSEILSA